LIDDHACEDGYDVVDAIAQTVVAVHRASSTHINDA
jgi:hypothetical protein